MAKTNVRVLLQWRNSTNEPINFILEPWAGEYRLAAGESFEFVVKDHENIANEEQVPDQVELQIESGCPIVISAFYSGNDGERYQDIVVLKDGVEVQPA